MTGGHGHLEPRGRRPLDAEEAAGQRVVVRPSVSDSGKPANWDRRKQPQVSEATRPRVTARKRKQKGWIRGSSRLPLGEPIASRPGRSVVFSHSLAPPAQRTAREGWLVAEMEAS